MNINQFYENQLFESSIKYVSLTLMALFFLSLGVQFLDKKSKSIFKSMVTKETEVISYYKTEHMLDLEREEKNISKFITKHYHRNLAFANETARLIVLNSDFNDIDPYLVASIIGTESSFNPNSISVVGAIGLMQVMPFWKDGKDKLSFIPNKKDNLSNASMNIRYGCAIIAKYINHYDRDIIKALAAYNGSKGSLKYPNKIKKRHKILVSFVGNYYNYNIIDTLF